MNLTDKIEEREGTPETLELRKLTSFDAEQYNNLRLEAFRRNPKSFARSYEEESQVELSEIERRLSQGTYIGIFDGDSLTGSVALSKEELTKMNHKGEVRDMYVDENKRSRGVGRKLLEALFSEAKDQGITELHLAVWTQNKPAVRLYKSMGFTIWGTERNALRTSEGEFIDEYHMVRKMELKPAEDELVEGGIQETQGEIALATRNVEIEKLLPSSYLNAFSRRENYQESQMHDAVVTLNEMISGNTDNASLWADAWGRAVSFEAFARNRYLKKDFGSAEENHFEDMTGGSRDVERWVTYSTAHLEEILERSTFGHLGTQHQVKRLFEDASTAKGYNLVELARHLKSALETKVFQNAARNIALERNKRLAASFGLQSVHQIIPAHRFQYPYYNHVTMAQLNAYLAGDRSEKVFGIGEWTSSALANGHHPIAR
ncbi:MAG: GNAT family N-acetyltransferase [Candidatus Gracilibacteria bacterium]